jgi:GINS complex subunit 1
LAGKKKKKKKKKNPKTPGSVAKPFLADVKRMAVSDALPAYNEDVVAEVVQEINQLYKKVEHLIASRPDEVLADNESVQRCGVLVYHISIMRDKRILLGYLMNRARRVQRLRLEIGSVLPASVKVNLSAQENRFFNGYDRLLSRYMQSVDVDLAVDLDAPPKDLYVEVRVMQQYGDIVTANGVTVRLDRGTTHYLRRLDAEPLIRQGIVKHIVS